VADPKIVETAILKAKDDNFLTANMAKSGGPRHGVVTRPSPHGHECPRASAAADAMPAGPASRPTINPTMQLQRLHRRWLAALCVAACVRLAHADDTAGAAPSPSVAPESEPAQEQSWSAHGQTTLVAQGHGRFNSPYQGALSLDPDSSVKETFDLTGFFGLRLWKGGEFYLNPELDQGFGLSDTVGVAGFPNGEAYKVGKATPYARLNRVFIRQVFALGSAEEPVEPDANTLAGMRPVDNLTLSVGKLSVVDLFDTNTYAHDPRADFLNWSIIDSGAFDYAADAWGFTYGGAAELSLADWTVRGGVFALSEEPNSRTIDSSFRQFSLIAEVERRGNLAGHPGKVKLLGFVNRGDMASYNDAVSNAEMTASIPDVAKVRRYASKSGVALNVEQEVGTGLGLFLRASASDGSKEAFEFTEINESLAAGASLQGNAWSRNDDRIGVAGVVNGISSAARRYFAAGGLGILIGDGQLPRYGSEEIVEAYYSAALAAHLFLAVDVQHIVHPAYNRDRGPVSVLGVRAHAEF
jgi:high affinity Mn2+ porin